MKLQALFEYTFPKINHKKVGKSPRGYNTTEYDGGERTPRVMQRKGVEHIGTGNFSSVYTNPKRSPEDVRKVSRAMQQKDIDGFYYYMIELAKHSDNGNPYFPRFRDITIYENPKGALTYSAKMERLYHVNSMSKSERLALYARLFGTDKADDYANHRIDNMRSDLEDVVNGVIAGHPVGNRVVDKDLKKAGEFIHMVRRAHNLSVDIHDDNIMIRKTPYGAQLVITDPMSFSGME